MEKGYMISDASKILEVENHVLRYWEEELELPIPRNEMGHRYYREAEIKLLRSIKDLKEQGFQLKAIKKLLPDLERFKNMDPKIIYKLREELNHQVMQEALESAKGSVTSISQARERYEKRQRTWQEKSYELEQSRGQSVEPVRSQEASMERLRQFEAMMSQMIRSSLEEVSQESEKRICEEVTIRMQKEMNYLLLQKEELHEKQVALLREILAQVKTEKKKKEPQEVPGSQKPESEVAATVEGAAKTAGSKKEERQEKQGKKRRKKKLFAKSVS